MATIAAVTYEELKRTYFGNAPGAPGHMFSDAELETDLRFAHGRRELGQDTPDSRGSELIECWITQELRGRMGHRRCPMS